MIGLVMAGGKGTRMQSDKEKLLLEYKKPLVLHVVDALKNSNCFEKIIAVTSPNSPQTQKILIENDVKIIETLGDTKKIWTSVVTTKSFQSSLNLEPECLISLNEEEHVHTGISVVNATEIKNFDSVEEDYLIINDKRVCLNVNTKTDFELLGSL